MTVSATLTGYAVPMALTNNRTDHTYVLSDAGDVWPCWGRAVNGTAVCSGVGDVQLARCLSEVSSKAGIHYMITGVCHQTSNRILYPVQKFVSMAQFYFTSVYMYGPYGRGTWRQLTDCSSRSGGATGFAEAAVSFHVANSLNTSGEQPGGQDMANDSKLATFDRKIADLYREVAARDFPYLEIDRNIAAAEVRIMVESMLEGDVTEEELTQLIDTQAKLNTYRENVVAANADGHVEFRELFKNIQEASVAAMRRNMDVLGHDRFKELYRIEDPNDAAKMFDPAAFGIE